MKKDYGLVITITVPLLFPSGSWLEAAEYVYPDKVNFVTLKVTLAMLEDNPDLVIVHTPLALVIQLAVPVAPFVHWAATVTLAIGCSSTLCT